jgi:hypothetical protein
MGSGSAVHAADYTVWRNNLGNNLLRNEDSANESSAGVIDLHDYLYWKSHYSETRATVHVQQLPRVRQPAIQLSQSRRPPPLRCWACC